jgi:hypothetical protein
MDNGYRISTDLEVSGSLVVSQSLIVSQSITAVSFIGDGSGLTYVTASIAWDGTRNGDAQITGSLTVSSSITASIFSGSFTGNGAELINLNLNGVQASGSNFTGSFSGSFIGDGSGLTGVASTGSFNTFTASFNTGSFTGSFTGDGSGLVNVTAWNGVLNGNAQITGSLTVSGASPIINLKGDTTIDESILISNRGDASSILIGTRSLSESTQTRRSIVIGSGSGEALVSGSQNIFIGNNAGAVAEKVQNTIAIGNRALNSFLGDDLGDPTTASDNIAIGTDALSLNVTGINDVAVGTQALNNLTSGNSNTAIGYQAGRYSNAASTGNVYIGNQAGPTASLQESNTLYIGNTAGTPLIKGNFLYNQVEIAGGVSSSFSGSFYGDGSNITGIVSPTAISASYGLTASYAEFAQTASYVQNAVSASYISGSVAISTSASYSNTATSASYSVTASYTVSASTATSASNASTASLAQNALTASVATTALNATSASNASTASYVVSAISASYVATAASTSFAGLASSASFIRITDRTTGTGPYYPVFVNGTDYRSAEIDSALYSYNADTNTLTVTASRAVSASHALTASYYNGSVVSASYAQTASLAPNYLPLTGGTVSGDLVVAGNLTAQQYIVSSSVTYFTESFSSGSTRFGDTLDDTHQFTGSLSITGSLQVGDNSAAASISNVGSLRYRTSGNNSYVDMSMQTGASTYEWVNIVQNNW